MPSELLGVFAAARRPDGSSIAKSLRANLKKYIKVVGASFRSLNRTEFPSRARWSIDGVPTRSTTGTFYLEYGEDGRRVQRPVGSSPREAKDAWSRQLNPGVELEDERVEEQQDPESLDPRGSDFAERNGEKTTASLGAKTYSSKIARYDI